MKRGRSRAGSLFSRFVQGVVAGRRMQPMTPGVFTRMHTGIWDGRTKLTAEERGVVLDLVVAKDFPPGTHVVSWSCATCEGSGEFVESSYTR